MTQNKKGLPVTPWVGNFFIGGLVVWVGGGIWMVLAESQQAVGVIVFGMILEITALPLLVRDYRRFDESVSQNHRNKAILFALVIPSGFIGMAIISTISYLQTF